MEPIVLVVLFGFLVFVGYVVRPHIRQAKEDTIIEEYPVLGFVVRRVSPELIGEESWLPRPHFRGIPPHELGPLPSSSQQYRLWVKYQGDTARFTVSPEFFNAHELGDSIWLMRVRRKTLLRGRVVTEYYLASV